METRKNAICSIFPLQPVENTFGGRGYQARLCFSVWTKMHTSEYLVATHVLLMLLATYDFYLPIKYCGTKNTQNLVGSRWYGWDRRE